MLIISFVQAQQMGQVTGDGVPMLAEWSVKNMREPIKLHVAMFEILFSDL